MARSEEQRIKLRKAALEEESKAYKALEKQLDDIYIKKIRDGKATQGRTNEEKKIHEEMYKKEKAHLEFIATEYDKEHEKYKDRQYEAEAYYDERKKQIKENTDAESYFWSITAGLATDAYQAYKDGDMERMKLSDSLLDKTLQQVENEKNIGTEKFVNQDFSSRINTLVAEEVVLKRELAIAESTGNEELARKIKQKIKNNQHETQTLETLQKSAEFQKVQHDIMVSGLKPLEDMKDKLESFAATAEAIATSPLFLMVTLAALLAKHFGETEQAAEDFRKSMGITVAEGAKFEKQAMNVAKNMGDAGVSFKDALGATESLVKEFGDMNMASEKNVETVMRMNKALGMSNDEAAKFLHTISSTLGGSVEQAEALAAGATNMARLAGVAPQAVIQDMSANADSFSAYIKDGGKNLAEAAVFAAKMGVSVATLTKMADHLLDIEGSIEKQMEAQVLTGKAINLEKARQLAYDGDLKGMGAALLEQVGSAAEWEQMRPEARKAMAAAMGMEVSEMTKMISKQEALKGLADGTLKTQEAMKDLSLAEVMDAKGITGPITDIKNSIQAIALNLMEVFRPVFSFVAMILKPIAATLGFVAKLLNNPLAKGVLYLYAIYKLINTEIYQQYVAKLRLFASEKLFNLEWWKSQKQKIFGENTLQTLRSKFSKENLKQMYQNTKDFMKQIYQKITGQKMLDKVKKEGITAEIKGMDSIKGKAKGLMDRVKGIGKGGGAKAGTPDMSKAEGAVSKQSPGTKGKGAGGFMKSIGKIDMNKVLKGAAAMIVVAGALFIFAKALQELPTEPAPYIGAAVGLGMLTGAVFLMGKMQGDLMKGSIAMLIMGAAFIPFAFGMSLIAGLDFGAVIAAAGALIIFTGAIFALGALMMSGAGAVLFGAGIVAFAALGATLVIFGAGLMLVATAAKMLSDSLSGVAEGLTQLVASSDGIFSLAAGLGALSLGFISLAGSMLLLLPFLPMLMLLGASGVIGQILGTSEGGGGEAAPSPKRRDKGKSRPEVITNMKLDRLTNVMEQLLEAVKAGGTVNMDGKKVGEVIGGAGTMGPLVG